MSYTYTSCTYIISCPRHGTAFIERRGPAEGEHGPRFYRCTGPDCDYEVQATGGGRRRAIRLDEDGEPEGAANG